MNQRDEQKLKEFVQMISQLNIKSYTREQYKDAVHAIYVDIFKRCL